MPWIARRRPEAGIRHADPHSGDGSLSGSHLTSPISMHYLGPPPFRVLQTLRERPRGTQALFSGFGGTRIERCEVTRAWHGRGPRAETPSRGSMGGLRPPRWRFCSQLCAALVGEALCASHQGVRASSPRRPVGRGELDSAGMELGPQRHLSRVGSKDSA